MIIPLIVLLFQCTLQFNINMSLKNSWVGYLDRGYFKIKQSILNKVRSRVPEITDFSETNLFVIIISIFAGLTEQVNYYIDQLMRESFITTARRYTSMVRLTRLIDYRLKAANPASVDLTVTLLDDEGNPFHLESGQEEIIPQDILIDVMGMSFYTTEEVKIKFPNNKGKVSISQFEVEGDEFNFGQSEPSMVYDLGTNYVHKSASVVIDSEPWVEVDSFGRSGPNSKHFIVDIDETGLAYIIFGDGDNGEIPGLGDLANIQYKTTRGRSGNIGAYTIDREEEALISLDHAHSIHIVNTNRATGGTLYESIDDIRKNAPLSLRTLDRAVTVRDYIDIAKMHPGVSSANIKFDCSRFIGLYILPKGGGLASQALLDDVENYFEDKKMVGTFLDVRSTGESKITLEISVTGNLRAKTDKIKSEVREALLEEYGLGKKEVGDNIRVSDIYAIVDNQPTVKYANIQNLYLEPYFFPMNNNTPLSYNLQVKGTNQSRKYILIFSSGSTFILRKVVGNFDYFESYITVGEEYENLYMKLTIEAGPYASADRWEFTIYPANQDIVIDDLSVPVLLPENLSIDVKETLL